MGDSDCVDAVMCGERFFCTQERRVFFEKIFAAPLGPHAAAAEQASSSSPKSEL